MVNFCTNLYSSVELVCWGIFFMIKWSLLSEKFGIQGGARKFEKLALMYVRDVYNQYNWQATPNGPDGNKDGHLGKGSEFDVWEEAKFRSDSLRRQDLDPTILSGLIQGNVRLIIFVSNAHLPEQLLSRSIIGARIKGIEVSCVLGKQLESWLFRHPECYKTIFENNLPERDDNDHLVEIYESSFFDTFSTDFNPFNVRTEMFVGEEYLLSITIYSSCLGTAILITDEYTPFILVKHPNFDNPDCLCINEGINVFSVLIRADKIVTGGISLRFEINSEPYFHITKEVIIQQSTTLGITYAQQLETTNAIKAIIDFQSSDSAQYIITLFAESGMGKSYVLKSIYTEYVLKRDMTIVCFESHRQNNINNLFLCRIILFFNYGNIFWGEHIKTAEEIVNFKCSALVRNTSALFDNNLLSELIDGCFDARIAACVIEKMFTKSKREKNMLVGGRSKSRIGRILLLDDFQYLDKKQAEFVFLLCRQLIDVKNNCVVVISATEGKFRDKKTEACFHELTPNIFSLHGLKRKDKTATLNSYFNLPLSVAEAIAQIILPNSPLLSSEILRIIRSKNPKSGEGISVLSAYTSHTYSNVILQNRFVDLKEQFYLLDILYRFKRGINNSFLYRYDKFEKSKLESDIQILIGRGLIKKDNNCLLPYHDYYILSYKQLRKKMFFNRAVGRYINYLLRFPNSSMYFDENQLLSQLIRCGKNYFKLFEMKIKEQVKLNIYATNFGTALYYCEYYYEILEHKDPATYTSEELYFLYLHAYCLVHCGKNGIAEQILEKVFSFSKPDSIEGIEAGAELLNQQFWNMNLDMLINNSYIIQMNAEHILKKELATEEKQRMRKAQSVCHNRRMVTQLLLEQYADARETYRTRLTMIARELSRDEFKPNAATLIMDYSRGIIHKSPKDALRLINIALRFFECYADEHIRRILICKIDLLVFHSITGTKIDEVQFRTLIKKLLDGQFYSESFKALLKYHACKIIETSKCLEQLMSSDSNRLSNITIDAAEKEIYSFSLETGIIPSQREKFLFDNLMAYIHVKNGKLLKAIDCLDSICMYVSRAGESYRLIAHHNRSNISSIIKIAWCTDGMVLEQDTFCLDCRFW